MSRPVGVGSWRTARAQRGYTLIEVIVAFALLALALSLLLGTLSGATRQVRWSGDAGRAALHAQSLLDQLGVGTRIEPGRENGDFEDGRYRWTLEVAPWEDPALPPDVLEPAGGALNRLYELTLAVEWGQGRPGERLRLRTLRLVQGDPLEASP
ncbi:prepilin-type N-terminal cleavage/methylation domain-containing protein [Lysobacter maris]|uniref:Prepilin-type N-terminal cleavage/methylation domain-containing protein n=1 Tax=Marilutibacter maris TaxID=1605891 RepID=A0A508AWR0_9GAMM|nr:prepilin-type N-terminal cleavage/methylation domain-containing protein [Lysobacter maris]KAB8186219.1 prepilin-type N-terminal cleavage/methylation domain-containing protein [Lysobacter maris]